MALPRSAAGDEKGGAQPEQALLTLSLDLAVRTALENNLELRAAGSDQDQALAEWEGAKMLTPHNPELSTGLGRRFAPNDQSTEIEVSLSQELEIAGQRSRRIDAARANLARTRAGIEYLRLRIATGVKVAFIEALLAASEVDSARQAESLSEELHRAAVERRNAGAATDLEVNLAGIGSAQSRREVLAATRRMEDSLARLRELMALPPSKPLQLLGELRPADGPGTDLNSLVQRALADRRDLSSLEHRVESLDREVELARSEAWPNLTVSATYAHEEGTDHIAGIGLSVPLPLFNRNQGRVAAARARSEKARTRHQGAKLQVEREVTGAYRRYQTARDLVEVFDKNILSQVSENLLLLRTSFQAGKIGLIQVLLVQRDLIQTRQEYVESVADLLRARALLELAVGGEIP